MTTRAKLMAEAKLWKIKPDKHWRNRDIEAAIEAAKERAHAEPDPPIDAQIVSASPVVARRREMPSAQRYRTLCRVVAGKDTVGPGKLISLTREAAKSLMAQGAIEEI